MSWEQYSKLACYRGSKTPIWRLLAYLHFSHWNMLKLRLWNMKQSWSILSIYVMKVNRWVDHSKLACCRGSKTAIWQLMSYLHLNLWNFSDESYSFWNKLKLQYLKHAIYLWDKIQHWCRIIINSYLCYKDSISVLVWGSKTAIWRLSGTSTLQRWSILKAWSIMKFSVWY